VVKIPAKNEVTITNNSNSKQFLFRATAPMRNRKEQPVIAIPLIGTDPSNTIFFRFFGATEEITFTFAIFDDGVDVSNGTDTSINTVNEQIIYLRDTVYGSDYDVSWTVSQDRYYPGGSFSGVITNLSLDNSEGGVSIVSGSITLKRGTTGNL